MPVIGPIVRGACVREPTAAGRAGARGSCYVRSPAESRTVPSAVTPGSRRGGLVIDIYEIWCDLAPGQRDLDLTDAVHAYLGTLRGDGRIVDYRLTRRKLGLGPSTLGEFHISIEVESLAQLDDAFTTVSERAEPVESLHHAVNSRVVNFQAALYRDFPDVHRLRGEERF